MIRVVKVGELTVDGRFGALVTASAEGVHVQTDYGGCRLHPELADVLAAMLVAGGKISARLAAEQAKELGL